MSPFWQGFLAGLFAGGVLGFMAAALCHMAAEEFPVFSKGGMVEPDKKDDYPVVVLPGIGNCYHIKKGADEMPRRDGSGPPKKATGPKDGRGEGKGTHSGGKGSGKGKGGGKGNC